MDGCPTLNILVGVSAHLAFIPILKNFPYVNTMAPTTWVPVGLLLINHYVWFRFFVDEKSKYLSQQRRYGYNSDMDKSFLDDDISIMSIMGFMFIFVWSVPLGFFISLMDIEETLPSSSMGHMYSSHSTTRASSGGIGGMVGGGNTDFYSQNNIGGDEMSDYAHTMGGAVNSNMQIPMGEERRSKKGGLFKKILDPLMAKKDMILTNVAMPRRKDK